MSGEDPMSVTTVAEFEAWLRDRDLNVQIFSSREGCFVVWLYAADDPELGVVTGEGSTLDEALLDACAKWDHPSGKGERRTEGTSS
jgi:hypothetical protein